MEEEKEGEILTRFELKMNYEAKLKELLRNLTLPESLLFSQSSKEFIKILKSDSGPEFLHVYLQTSSQLIEISQAWDFQKGKPGFVYVLNLVAAILKHGKGNNASGNGGSLIIGRVLDKFASILIKEKMEGLYEGLSSKEAKRQNAVLLFLATIVRRSSHLAWEVAKTFDFKLSSFPKLAELRLRVKKTTDEKRKRHSTRKAFVSFAMSFLESSKPRLLRAILQQKEMYSGVLRGLGNDDEETVIYILSVLRDRVLVPESLVPPSLRSVLFGSVTLEKLAEISGRDNFGDASGLAHGVLVMVCTDPVNGLMPDFDRRPNPLRGNLKRLVGLMKKLKATEVEYHKELLLDIVKGRPLFGSAYFDEFPYSLEDLSSSNWFAAVSLAADVVSSVSDGLSFGFLDISASYDSPHLQSILKCIAPCPLTKLVMNKGLLHADYLVKHVMLKFLVEALKLLDSLVNALDISSRLNEQMMRSLSALKAEIQNGFQMWLPDPQVLFSLLFPLSNHFKSLESTRKRKAEAELTSGSDLNANKRLKGSAASENLDILISGVNPSALELSGDGGDADSGGMQQSENGVDLVKFARRLWGLHHCPTLMDLKDVDSHFYSKILDSLKLYYRTMPTAIEGLFDLFKYLPNNPLVLPAILQQSLLQLLNEHVSQFSKSVTPMRTPPQMYKHLCPFIVLLMGSRAKHIREQAYSLAKAAMFSTGAFDSNTKEIGAWFLFIPGPNGNHVSEENLEEEILQKLSFVVVSFLCDAVSTAGNNLYKYMQLLKHYIYDSEGDKDRSPKVSPFTICILEKCVRLLVSESGSFTIPQKSMISLYVCNTVKYLFDTQVDAGTLSLLVALVLSDKLKNCVSTIDILELTDCPCEWRPLMNLLRFARDIQQQTCYNINSSLVDVIQPNNSFNDTLTEIKGVLRREYDTGFVGLMVGFSFSLMCIRPPELLQTFPLVLSISNNLLEVPFVVLSSILFLEPSYLGDVFKLWPDMFFAALHSVTHCEEDEKISDYIDIDSAKAASVAFSRFLRGVPFCVLFASVAQSNNLHLLEQSGLQKLLLDKVTGMPIDHLISSLCNVLFWMNHANSCYRFRPSDELHMLSKICFILAEHLLKQLLAENVDIVNPTFVKNPVNLHYAVEVAEIIFNHPAVTTALSSPLFGDTEFLDSIFRESLEKFLGVSEQIVHQMDHHVLNLIRTASELLSLACDDQISEQDKGGRKQISRALKSLKEKLLSVFKKKFDACIQSMDFKPFVPTFYAFHSLVCFISPFEMLDLVKWLFSQIDLDNTTAHKSSKENALFVSLHLTCSIFDSLSVCMRQQYPERKLYSSFGSIGVHFDVSQFEQIYKQVFEIACCLKSDIADKCLLKAVRFIKMYKPVQHPNFPSIMVLSRAVASTPVGIISYCLHKVNRTTADLLFLITETNPLYMSVFIFMVTEILDKSLHTSAGGTQETCSFSDEELVMLVPTISLCLNSVTSKFAKPQSKPFQVITSEYGRLLLGGFSKWKIFVSGVISEIDLDGPLTASTEEFSDLFSGSLLGKAILMVQAILASSEGDVDQKLDLFNYVCPSDGDDIFDYFHGEKGLRSLKRPLEFVNIVVGKINFCRMLLISDHSHTYPQLDNGEKKTLPTEVASDIEKLKTRLLKILINSWKLIAKKFQYNADYAGDIDGKNLSLFRFLEVFVMNNILELASEVHDSLTKLDSLPFIEQLVKSFLRYRFGDPATLKVLRSVLTFLSQCKFSCASLIHLLLGHSQFAASIHRASESLVSTQFGLIFTPMQSILRTIAVSRIRPDASHGEKNKSMSTRHLTLLELVKLVRVLFRINAQHRESKFGEEIDLNSRELVLLLLSSYGATSAEVDVELYNLISEIESTDKLSASTVAQMDYLWGIASLRVRESWEQDKDMQTVDTRSMEVVEEHRKIKFRENIPVDPRLCAQTVLYLPYSRFVNGGTSHELQKDSSTVIHEVCSAIDNQRTYDPFFILRFSIHCLSMSYIEPVEFASLGLLAICFASLSSPDDDMRKLGYEALAKFKCALENSRKKKDVARLRLLLSCLQNGIEEPWQRIPSIIAVFFAEASFVLLDFSHVNYSTISKYISNSPSVNMKAIPLFRNLFWSSSPSFREDKLWMLQLLYAGLNTEDDAQTYIRNSIFETLMSFYSSPLSDNDSRELIIQIVKKAAQLHKAVWYLVQHCGLILWLSSIVTSHYGSECQDLITLRQLPIVLEVVHEITSPRNILEWLQKHAMEQLSELSSHLYKLLVRNVELIKEQSNLLNLILITLKLVMKISQKRKIYQPHFTLSEEGLSELYEAVAVRPTKCFSNMALGLKVVLMSAPPVNILQMDKEKLSRFVSWAVTTAIQSKSTKPTQPKESLMSKLLRWLTASVILGNLSGRLSKLNKDSLLRNPSLQSLQSWLGLDEKGFGENVTNRGDITLAASIFYLLQLEGFSHSLLPSAVSALCFLLFPCSSSELESLLSPEKALPLLCSKIQCPVETNPAWRWSYYQPWRDLTLETSDIKKLDEIHAVHKLLILLSNILVKKSGFSRIFPLEDIDNLRVHEWERRVNFPGI